MQLIHWNYQQHYMFQSKTSQSENVVPDISSTLKYVYICIMNLISAGEMFLII